MKGISKLVWLLALAGIVTASCHKNTECRATIYVINKTTKAAVSGASVNLSAGQINETQTTDASGRTYHSFKLQSILDIKVTSSVGNGTGILKLEPGNDVEKTVEVY